MRPNDSDALEAYPSGESRCWLVNGTDLPVDVYLNYAPVAEVQDLRPGAVGACFCVEGAAGRPYGEYALEVRERDEATGPVLATASVELVEDAGFEAVVHRTASGDFALAVFADDFTPADRPRLEVRHAATPASVGWTVRPAAAADGGDVDVRTGRLSRAEYQVATDVAPGEYVFETYVDGELSAFHRGLVLEPNRYYVVTVTGAGATVGVRSVEEYEARRGPRTGRGAEWRERRGIGVRAVELPAGDGDHPQVHPARPCLSNDGRDGDATDAGTERPPYGKGPRNATNEAGRQGPPRGKGRGKGRGPSR
jgi:hypothetical protein